MANNNIFAGQITPKDVTAYTLFRGVPDYSNLTQFNAFESGYSMLVVLEIPTFLEELANKSDEYKKLIDNYRHILEYEFKGISGFEDITSDTSEITNGVANLQLITKVNKQSASQFSMRYTERSGLILSKVHKLFLTGIKDPTTQTKTYHGLLEEDGNIFDHTPGYEHETFQFLYFVTDNTRMNIEQAYLIVAAQPTAAPVADIVNSEAGDFSWKEIDLQFNGIPLENPAITAKAKEFLAFIRKNIIFEQMKFGYDALKTTTRPGFTGTIDAASNAIDDNNNVLPRSVQTL